MTSSIHLFLSNFFNVFKKKSVPLGGRIYLFSFYESARLSIFFLPFVADVNCHSLPFPEFDSSSRKYICNYRVGGKTNTIAGIQRELEIECPFSQVRRYGEIAWDSFAHHGQLFQIHPQSNLFENF